MRFYERQGLVPEPPRASSGYRAYPRSAARRLRFIVSAKELGFTLREIAELLSLRASDDAACADVQVQALAKIEDIEERIRLLSGMKSALAELVAQCGGERPISECPILDALDDGGEP